MFRFTVVLALLCFQVVFGAVPRLQPQPSNGRIVGGSNAAAGQFPYQISLRNSFNFHFCGGSIINSRWVLTAAHCTVGQTASGTFVIVGSHLMNSGGVKHSVAQIRSHPSYNSGTLANDVSVIQTTSDIAFNSNVQPVPLINRDVQSGSLVVSGWGQDDTGSAPNNLKYLYHTVISRSDCSRRISINDDTVCAYVSTGRGICFGDSGGPLVVQGEGQVGVNSFVVGGCGQGYPDGFASVFYHRSWIINNTN